MLNEICCCFFFQAEDGIRDGHVTGVQTCALPICGGAMFMEAGNCITYSIHAPESLVEGMSFQESYAFFDQWVIDALGDRKSVVEGKSGGCVGRGGMVKREGGRDRQGVGGLRDEIV